MMRDDATPPDVRTAAALDYQRAAWPLLPLDDGLTPLEHDPLTAREDVIRAWARHPGAQPGVVLGRPIAGGRHHLVALIDACTDESTAYLAARGAVEMLF